MLKVGKNMKRLGMFIVFLALTACCIMGLYSCKDKECDHEWGEWSVSSVSTCQAQGTKVRKCLKCSEPQNDFVDIASHSYDGENAVWEWSGVESATVTFHCKYGCGSTREVGATVTRTLTLQPSCTENGVEAYTATASIDGKGYSCVITNPVPALGHREVEDPAIAPTCESVGYTRGSHCSVCRAILSTQSEIAALGHKYDTENAVWTWDGVEEATVALHCERGCGSKKDASATVSVNIVSQPSCTENGIGVYTATASIDNKEYNSSITKPVPALGHREVEDPAVAPTCESVGYTRGSHCSVCRTTLSEQSDIAALGHKYDTDNAVWTWDGVEEATVSLHCKHGCGSTKGANATVTGGITSQPTCTKNGIETYTATASIDGNIYNDARTKAVPALGHREVEDPAVAPTCESVGYTRGSHCSVCRAILSEQSDIAALEHIFDADNIVWNWNGIEGASAILSCRFDASHKREIPANITAMITEEPTCTEVGVITYTAIVTIDGKTYTDTETGVAEALGHRWDGGTVTVKPTAVSDGERHFKCTGCDAEKDEKILYPITRADWNSLISALTDTNNVSITRDINVFTDSEVLLKQTEYHVIDGEKISIISVDDSGNVQAYIYRYRGEDCIVTLDGEEWHRAPYSNDVEYSACFALPEAYILSIVAAYDSFVYDELTDSYFATEVPVLEGGNVAFVLGEVAIEIGENVRRVSFSTVEENYNVSMDIIFSCFGEATVEIPHVHEWSAWETVVELTCTEDGLLFRQCTECLEEQRQELYHEGHDYAAEITNPTCTAGGYTSYICRNCPYSYNSDYVEPIGHSWGAVEDDGSITYKPCINGCEERLCLRTLTAAYEGELLLVGESVLLSDVAVTAILSDGTEIKIYDFEMPVTEVTADGSNYLAVNYHTLDIDVSVPAIYDNLEGVTPSSEFVHTIENGEITITGYTGSASEIVIPSHIDRVPVRYIGNSAFSNCSYLKSVTIPPSIIKIGRSAFAGCPIKELVIPDSVTEISGENGFGAFENCTMLESVVIGNGIMEIEQDTFRGCTYLESVTIGNAAVTIGEYAFYDCSYLNILTFGECVYEIGSYAFGNCTSLTEITFPSSLRTIGNGAFNGCEHLSSVIFNDGLKTVGREAFSTCPIKELVIPDSVTEISGENGFGAFENCIMLESVVIGNGLSEIEKETFRGCNYLKTVTIGNSVYTVGESAFLDCSALESITFGECVREIGTNAFRNCTALTEISFPSTLYSIGNGAFSACSRLSSVTFNDGLRTIGREAFSACPIKKIVIPDSVTEISGENGLGAFENCTMLESVVIGNRLSEIEQDTFRGCTALKSVTVGASLLTVGQLAFDGCTSLDEIDLGDKLRAIENRAFRGCTSLKKVTYPGSATVADNAFEDCPLLES